MLLDSYTSRPSLLGLTFLTKTVVATVQALPNILSLDAPKGRMRASKNLLNTVFRLIPPSLLTPVSPTLSS